MFPFEVVDSILSVLLKLENLLSKCSTSPMTEVHDTVIKTFSHNIDRVFSDGGGLTEKVKVEFIWYFISISKSSQSYGR